MALVLLGTFPIFISEYGFQSRSGIMAGFTEKWHPRRTFLRFILWILVLILIGLRPQSVLLVGLGVVLGELGTVVLRRRLRIDIHNGMPHGLPYTHLIPIVIGILLYSINLLIHQQNAAKIPTDPIQFGTLAPLVIFSVTALWGWATIVTVSVVDLVRPGQVRDDSEHVGAGEVIGVLERMVTFVLVASGAFTAVGFVIAAKAAARFPLFKEKAFAEYFLIGTLTSVGLALLLGLLVLAGR